MLKSLYLSVLFLAMAIVPPAYADLPSLHDHIGSGFGVQIKPWHTTDDDLAKIKQTGFGLVRWGISWNTVEKTPGVYDWSASDAFFRRLHAAHLRSVVTLGQGNPIYTGTTGNYDKESKQSSQPLPPVRPQDVKLFAQFAAAAAKRYAGENAIWEIWNEPDLSRFWPPNADPNQYAALASDTCRAIKQADPAATVIGPGAAGMPDHATPMRPNLMVSLSQSPAADCLDAVSAHDYRYSGNNPVKTPESIQANNLASLQWMDQHFGRKPLVCSEWGFAAPMVSAQQQAAYPIRALLSNLLSQVPMTIWYEWKDPGHDPVNPEDHYGLLTYDGGAKDGFNAVAAVLPKIQSAVVVSRKPVGSDDVYAVVVRQPGGQYGLVYWTTADTDGRGIGGQRMGGRPQALSVGSMTLPLQPTPAYADLGSNVPNISLH